ncbi:MAG: hypothetical protein QXW47_10290 [Candidatus Jordarchaeales archaeon]
MGGLLFFVIIAAFKAFSTAWYVAKSAQFALHALSAPLRLS